MNVVCVVVKRNGVEDGTNKKAAKKRKKRNIATNVTVTNESCDMETSFFYLAAGAMVCAAPDSSRELVTCSMSL